MAFVIHNPGFWRNERIVDPEITLEKLKSNSSTVELERVPINKVASQFSICTNLKNVCSFYNIPLEYALKVQAHEIRDFLVSSSINALNIDTMFSVIFKISYIQEKRVLNNTEAELFKKDPIKGKFFVREISVGNELTVIMTIRADSYFREKFRDCLEGQQSGNLTTKIMKKLVKESNTLDEIICKRHFELSMIIFHFDKVQHFPTKCSIKEMMKTLEQFQNRYDAWSIKEPERNKTKISEVQMSCSFVNNIVHNIESSIVNNQKDLKNAPKMFCVAVALENCQEGDGITRSSNDDIEIFCKIFKLLCQCNERGTLLESLRPKWMARNLQADGEEHLQNITSLKQKLLQTVYNLDFISSPDEREKNWINDSNLKKEKQFIKSVENNDQGENLNILMVGKTGHGKSSTGNSILGTDTFETSDNCQSFTKTIQDAVCMINGRKIKIVDTPGIYDTSFHKTSEMLEEVSIHFCNAVSRFPEGFEALLLVYRIRQRMTSEEEKTIAYLKIILGQNIIKEQCVCVFTHKEETDNDATFKKWCQEQKGAMKNLLEECNNRCVLFNNKTLDKREKNSQRQELIKIIDEMRLRSHPYRCDQFDEGKEERLNLITEHKKVETLNVIKEKFQILKTYWNDIKTNAKFTTEEHKTLTEMMTELMVTLNSSHEFDYMHLPINKLFDDIKKEEMKNIYDIDEKIEKLIPYQNKIKEELDKKYFELSERLYCQLKKKRKVFWYY